MQRPIVIYQSKYGYTKTYAQWIADALHCPIVTAAEAEADANLLAEYDILIYGGALYIGAINGISLLTTHPDLVQEKTVIVFTVSLSPVEKGKTDFEAVKRKNFSPQLLEQIDFFHFRGGMNYSALPLSHKLLMSAKRLMTAMNPHKTPDDQQFLRSFGSTSDFRNEEAIKPLVEYVRTRCL